MGVPTEQEIDAAKAQADHWNREALNRFGERHQHPNAHVRYAIAQARGWDHKVGNLCGQWLYANANKGV